MKRFWKDVAVTDGADGFGITLDGRPLRTPARASLLVPTQGLADAIADEWRDSPDEVDPRAMPLTGLANAAIDRIAPQRDAFAADLARYAESDLFAYRADGPRPLVERQTVAWDPLLQWARRRFDIDFAVTAGVTFVAQPEDTVRKLGHAVAALDPFRLAALSPLVTIGGSLVAALAVLEEEVSPAEAWAAVTVDDIWQRDQWGEDAEAAAALRNRERDFLAAARLLSLLD
ncbi:MULTISPECIES: ATP12 family chaperone protein [Sphingomonas]|uniref:ATP12 family chaperone protein n=1 Tax=Sphingomonas TaxID=13687 RepID=UPI000DEFFDE0|nr:MULTISPECIES: ATP12 family protein [Sphingomonas]